MSRRIPKILKNKYAIVIISFLMYILFFDAHDLISQMKIRYELHQINEQMQYLKENTDNAKEQTIELTSNRNSLEKFAREQYKMKRDDEEIFVIIESSSPASEHAD